LRVRGAGNRDLREIDRIVKHYNFPNFDIEHLEMLLVVEVIDSGKILAVCSLSTILETTFVPNPDIGIREKIESLKLAVEYGAKGTIELGYNSVHALGVKIPALGKALLNKFGFQEMIGKQYIKFVK
jgi:hypothetical protein